MSRTYTQVVKQIESLKREAEVLRRKEVDGVVVRIKDAIAHYGLTAADLGLKGRAASAATAATKGPKKRRGKAKAKPAPVAKFRDEAGNTWVGRGPRPRWLREALVSGKSLADFAV
jgi:DNA-binding protein H-NS